jgi:hypothetical protein
MGTEGDQLSSWPNNTETSLEVFYPIEFMFEDFNVDKISAELRSLPEFYIAEEMNSKMHAYNGVAHMEVAALMDDQYNNPKKSWKYLEAAGYWVGKKMPEAQATVLEAAMHLCQKHKWFEALEVLEFNKKHM